MKKTTQSIRTSLQKKNELGNNPYFNLKIGIGGALFMSILVYFINADHGAWPASIAAFKQAAYTFLMAGTNLKIAENLAIRIKQKVVSFFIAVIVPSVITIAATYLVHSLKGTPEPFASTIPTMMLGPPSIALFVYQKQRQLSKVRNQKAPEKSGVFHTFL